MSQGETTDSSFDSGAPRGQLEVFALELNQRVQLLCQL